MLVKGPCAIGVDDGLVSKLLPVLLYPLKALHRCTLWQPEDKPVGRETGTHGSDILGQQVPCWQLSFPGESFQCHS